MRCFFEERAFKPDGSLVAPKEKCINKVGHNLHVLVPEFKAVSLDDPRVAGVCRSLGMRHPLVAQSMYIFKQPGIGGAVLPHVDGAFLYTEPQSVVGLWWPLEACTTTNGCLWVVPGSHRRPVSRVFRRGPPGGPATEFFPEAAVPFDLQGAVPVEMKAGGMVVLHAAVVHYSEENHSNLSRHAYSIHVIEGAPGFEYSARNWLRPGPEGFPALY